MKKNIFTNNCKAIIQNLNIYIYKNMIFGKSLNPYILNISKNKKYKYVSLNVMPFTW